jgi:hypothetical protein
MADNTNTTVNPLAVAKAIAKLIPDATVRDKVCSYGAFMYVPVKIGNRSPIVVYEAVRGQFDGDCQVILAFDVRVEEAKALKAEVAAHAEALKAEEGVDPGDPKKVGWKMKCSQVLAALEGATVVSEHKPKAKASQPDLDELLKDPAFKAALLAKLLG